jgi:hypothetical protein
MTVNLSSIAATASASELASWIKEGKISPVELTQATLAGI